jgi:hypothetical protein
MDGAHAHHLNTWIFCYETSALNSESRTYYEKLLREFVHSKARIVVFQPNAEFVRGRAIAALNRKIKETHRLNVF